MIKSNLTWATAPIRVFLATLLLCGLGGHASEPPETQAPDTRSGGRKQVLIVTGEDHGRTAGKRPHRCSGRCSRRMIDWM